MKASTVLALIFTVVILTMVFLSLSYPNIARFGPLLAGIPATALLLFQILYENFSGKGKSQKNQNTDQEKVTINHKTVHCYVELGLWIMGLLTMTYLFGIVLTFPVFTFAYLRRYRHRWLQSILIPIVVFAVIYGLFDRLLGMYLYQGILFE